MSFSKLIVAAMASLCLAACTPNAQAEEGRATKKHVECADRFCSGDVGPAFKKGETVLKLNNQWFVGPDKYFSSAGNTASFEWWNHGPLDPAVPRPPDAQAAAVAGKGYDFSIAIFLFSRTPPASAHNYQRIEMAQKNGWILSREAQRPGLDVVRMAHVKGPDGQFMDRGVYFVATDLRGPDGFPPVAICYQDRPNGNASGIFSWQSGIWAALRMNQKNCKDWPEIYLEIERVLKLLKKA